ncbi:MAG TPA: retropepsin-like aspartic protease [Rhizomicrobium sp.]|jgi:predicted aspartyl protease|nr:retropepsin-like aspartic protease [Rhizomicrobium sp.]
MGITTILASACLALGCLAPMTVQAEDCGPLTMIDTVQMTAQSDHLDTVPISINGASINFLLDTGGVTTQIGRKVAEALKLPIRQGSFEMYDATGHISRDQVTVPELTIGRMKGKNATFPVAPDPDYDGILSMDYFRAYDIDVDFGTDRLNFFSHDHCPGHVIYWHAPAVAVLPITMHDGHITVPITLDDHQIMAIIDTGASMTSLRLDIAKRTYGLIPGTEGTSQNGYLNGDTSLPTYGHIFKQLALGDIIVSNPRVTVIPDAMNRNGDKSQQTGDRALQVRDDIVEPEAILGMNILQKLHIYFAFGEDRMYITPASSPASGSAKPAP